MKPWKVIVGIGAACAACCALLLAGGLASLSAAGVALWRCAGELLTVGLVGAGALALGAAAWRRRRLNAQRCRCGGIGCGTTIER